MIVREYPENFIMIAQHDHAAISGLMAKMWQDKLFRDSPKRPSVEYAAQNHDIGWKWIDTAPFWNDLKKTPYTFTNYPTAPKTVLYRYGIEEVAQKDSYAALLCNRHYSRFLQKNPSEAAQKFIQEQKTWSKNVKASLDDFDQDSYDFHYGILQMLDDISLFICLNEPGATGDELHPFFKNGISKNEGLTVIQGENVHIHWRGQRTIKLDPFPFTGKFIILLKQRTVTKKAIKENGLVDSYQSAPEETVEITLTPNR